MKKLSKTKTEELIILIKSLDIPKRKVSASRLERANKLLEKAGDLTGFKIKVVDGQEPSTKE